jgi:uncharacterized membrane protein YGL010W
MDDTRSGGLLAWQFREYPGGHTDRRSLLLHAVTVPLFMAGTLGLLVAPFSSIWLLAAAVPAMILSLALQGRAHRLEAREPAPFRGPLDAVARLFLEQWITFPRFVMGGGFTRNWRAAAGQEKRG